MNIVFYSLLTSAPWGGSENLWHKTAIAALENGHKVLAIIQKAISNNPNILLLISKGAEICVVTNYLSNPLDRILNKLKPSYATEKFRKKLFARIDKFTPNRILINQPGCFDIQFDSIVKFFLRETDLHFSICSHSYLPENILSNPQRKELSTIFEKAEVCYFVSRVQSEAILTQLNIHPKQIRFINNPLNDTAKYLPYPSKIKVPQFAVVGSLDVKWKGQDMLLEILSEDRWQVRGWRLNFYGEGADFLLLQKLIERNHLSQKVSLRGFESNQQAIWKNNQILLVPSKIDAAPSVLLEAMTCGRTAVCSNVGFVKEWIANNENGFIAKSTSKEDFAEALETAWHARQNWEEMGLTCKNILTKKLMQHPQMDFLNKITT